MHGGSSTSVPVWPNVYSTVRVVWGLCCGVHMLRYGGVVVDDGSGFRGFMCIKAQGERGWGGGKGEARDSGRKAVDGAI